MTAPVRVLHVTDHLRTGGVARVLLHIVDESHRRGDVVGVMAGGGELWAELPADVRRYRTPRRTTPADAVRLAVRMRRAVRADRWQVVHAHQRGVALLARLAGAGTGARVVEHVHSTFELRRGPARLVSFRGHRLIACGSAVRRMLVDDLGRSADRVVLVRNAVPDVGHGRDLSLPCGRGGAPTILGVGRLVPQKDPLRFLAVARCLAADATAVRAEWVGDGELAAAVAAELRRAPLPDVAFTGPTTAVVEKILSADVVLLTSRWEGLPLVALEASALGRGVVAPDVGSCRDVVVPGENGLLYPPDATPEEIAALLREVLDPDTLRCWGAAGRARFLRDGGMARFAAGIRGVYDDLVAQGRRG